MIYTGTALLMINDQMIYIKFHCKTPQRSFDTLIWILFTVSPTLKPKSAACDILVFIIILG